MTAAAHAGRALSWVACVSLLGLAPRPGFPQGTAPRATASSAAADGAAAGALDGDRFSVGPSRIWRGAEGASTWWWSVDLGVERAVGAILAIQGTHPFVLENAPRECVWEVSRDGTTWSPLESTRIQNETRIFRLHRLPESVRARHLRCSISSAHGAAPALREIEVFERTDTVVNFPPWCIVVNATHDTSLPGHGQEFLPLARSAPGWENLEGQQVTLTTLSEDFVAAEPPPLCAFISGTFKDWCEVDRATWRGLEQILAAGRLPMWASCGGAQGLAILSHVGTRSPWSCPHCPGVLPGGFPIYGHIGHTESRPCGDYSGCVFERGPHEIRQVRRDPVLAGLPRNFLSMESHCGQIQVVPDGWILVAEGGTGTSTRIQCLRRTDRPIYAAQFHIEMAGTPESSRAIVGGFLRAARKWNATRGVPPPLAPPDPWE